MDLALRDRIILALDFPSATQALDLVDRLEDRVSWVKVGLQLFVAAGPSIVQTLTLRGLKVFLDLKLHDIPNTVAAAVRASASTGASLLTVHAGGGSAMLTAAVEAAAKTPGAPRLLAVTVLTSMDAPQLQAVGVPSDFAAQVLRMAHLAQAAGIPDLVCSPEEVTALRNDLGPAPLLVVPGIRPAGGCCRGSDADCDACGGVCCGRLEAGDWAADYAGGGSGGGVRGNSCGAYGD